MNLDEYRDLEKRIESIKSEADRLHSDLYDYAPAQVPYLKDHYDGNRDLRESIDLIWSALLPIENALRTCTEELQRLRRTHQDQFIEYSKEAKWKLEEAIESFWDIESNFRDALDLLDDDWRYFLEHQKEKEN